MEQRVQPFCLGFLLPLTVDHVIVECPEFNEQRLSRFDNINNIDLSKVLEETPQRVTDIENVSTFLRSVQLLNKILLLYKIDTIF